MVVNFLTNHVYTWWGEKYGRFKWDDNWETFLLVSSKEQSVRHIIYWFDTNILRRIGKDSKTTLDVRIRIVCGMINKLSASRITFQMKQNFMECIWDTYTKFSRNYYDWYFKWIIKLPF